jgi:hypothetical protein
MVVKAAVPVTRRCRGTAAVRATRAVLVAAAAVSLLTACAGTDSADVAATDGELGDAFGSSASSGQSAADASSAALSLEGPTAGGGCALTVTGDHSTTIAAGSASSDYWLTPEQVALARDALAETTVSADGETMGAAAPDDGVAPVFNWLVINCGDEQGEGLSILANTDATSEDVPFGPGRYVIAPGFLSGSEDRTQFSAVVNVGVGSEVYALTAGTIDVTRFDASGVAGSVSMDVELSLADGTTKHATLSGTFEFGCSGGDACA